MLGCFSSMTNTSSRPRAKSRTVAGSNGSGQLELEQADAERRDRLLVGEPKPAERLAHLPVGDARRGDADPGVGRVGGGAVEPVRRRVGDREAVAHLVDLALEVEAERREQAAFGAPRRLEPVDRRGAPDGSGRGRARPTRCRRRRRRRSSSRSTGRSRGTSRSRGGRARAPRRGRRDRASACGGRRGLRPTTRASVELLALGSSPTNATAPPVRDVPAYTAWRSASAARSTPGALPYQMPTTPS